MKPLFTLFFLLLFFGTSELFGLDLDKNSQRFDNFPVSYSVGDKSFEEIKTQKMEKGYNYFSFGYIFETVWFKLDLKNIDKESVDFYLEFSEAFADVCDFYIKDGENFRVYKNGLHIDLEDREIKKPLPTVLLKFAPGEEKVVYVRYKSRFASFGSFRLYQPVEYIKSDTLAVALYSLYFGAVLIIALYNLFLFFSLKDLSYLYYVGYVSVFALWVFLFCGFSLYLINGKIHYILHFSTPLAFFFMTLFTQKILDLKEKFPKGDFILSIFVALLFIFSVWVVFDLEGGYHFLNLSGLFLLPAYLIIAVIAIKIGIKTAKYYLIALSIYLSAMISLSAMAMGIIDFNFYAKYSYIVGSLLEIVLFSFLLAYRINLLRQEKYEAQKKILELKEDEAIRLEMMVDEKTAKLQGMVVERELLIKEVHHRVKNNLQTVIGLLAIQKTGIDDENIKRWINETINRIKSISIVHELLYSSNDIANIEAKEYFEKVFDSISVWLDEGRVVLKRSIEDFELDIDSAITLGIIVVEIVTNSLKHAFKGVMDRCIEIKFSKNTNGVVLEIRDNGNGFNIQDVDLDDSLGIRLVQNMSKKLNGGRSYFFNNNGSVFVLEFQCK